MGTFWSRKSKHIFLSKIDTQIFETLHQLNISVTSSGWDKSGSSSPETYHVFCFEHI